MDSVERVAALLKRCEHGDSILPPTALYNEGWMLRLVLDWASRHPDAIEELHFEIGSRWYSEALLGSRFRPRHRGDRGGEGFTHADAVIGHFRVRDDRGDIELLPDARQLLVIEAKMASGLSGGTTRAKNFNQAARNVACLAHLACGQHNASTIHDVGFTVLAPAAKIDEGAFQAVEAGAILASVQARAASYDDAAVQWCEDTFRSILTRCRLRVVAWEHICERISTLDPDEGQQLTSFYQKCLAHNHVEPASKTPSRRAKIAPPSHV